MVTAKHFHITFARAGSSRRGEIHHPLCLRHEAMPPIAAMYPAWQSRGNALAGLLGFLA